MACVRVNKVTYTGPLEPQSTQAQVNVFLDDIASSIDADVGFRDRNWDRNRSLEANVSLDSDETFVSCYSQPQESQSDTNGSLTTTSYERYVSVIRSEGLTEYSDCCELGSSSRTEWREYFSPESRKRVCVISPTPSAAKSLTGKARFVASLPFLQLVLPDNKALSGSNVW